MKHSTDTAANRARLEPQVSLIAAPPLRRLLPLVAVDLGARLAAPFTLIVLASGPSRAALVGATGVTLFAAARAGLSGWAYDAASREAWTSVVSAARNHDVATLRNRPDAHGVASLTDAVAQIVQLRANDVPRGIADALALASTLLAVVVVLGWSWLLVGGLALGAASVVVIVAQRRMRTAQREAFERFSEATHDFEVLTEAAAELRAHGCEERHANDLLGKAAAMAAAQRRTATASAMLGLFPMGVTLLVASLPLGLGALLPSSPAGEVVRAGVLGMAALAFGLGVVRAAEAWGRSAAHRESLAGFLSTARRLETTGDARPDLRKAEIALHDLSVVHPNTDRATPANVTLRWRPEDGGLAITGANGSGKSTLALCMLGLLRPTAGAIRYDGHDADALDWRAFRQHLSYVAQDSFVTSDRSVAWHLRLLLPAEASDEELRSALETVGLWPILSRRAGGDAHRALDVPASELSGGEVKRMHLARALVGAPQLVVLDEPEAGLDESSRAWLRHWLAELSQETRVVVIAHDRDVIPPSFTRLDCDGGGADSTGVEPVRDEAGMLARPTTAQDTHAKVVAAHPLQREPTANEGA